MGTSGNQDGSVYAWGIRNVFSVRVWEKRRTGKELQRILATYFLKVFTGNFIFGITA